VVLPGSHCNFLYMGLPLGCAQNGIASPTERSLLASGSCQMFAQRGALGMWRLVEIQCCRMLLVSHQNLLPIRNSSMQAIHRDFFRSVRIGSALLTLSFARANSAVLNPAPEYQIGPSNATESPMPSHCWNPSPRAVLSQYPESARRQGLQARLLLEFGFADDGRPNEVKLLAFEPAGAEKLFTPSAGTFLDTYLRCQPEGGTSVRYRLSFVFQLQPWPRPRSSASLEAYESLNPPIVVTAAPIKGIPPRPLQ
jgi:hypothetical protein